MPRGIPLGVARCSHNISEVSMSTAGDPEVEYSEGASRLASHDEREGVIGVLAAVGEALAASNAGADLHAVFENEARRAAAATAIRLREVPRRFQARLVTPTRTHDSIVLAVPSADPGVQAVLEASF